MPSVSEADAGLQHQSLKLKYALLRFPDVVRCKVFTLALQDTELSTRKLAVTFIDQEDYFVSEAST